MSRLARYPIKGCGPELLEECDVDVAGLRNDRVLAVVVGDRVITQRQHPGLARVRPALDDASQRLTLAVPEQDTVQDRLLLSGRTRDVALFGRPVAVVDQSPRLSEWFSRLIGRPATLVGAPATTRRTTPGAVTGETVLSDIGSVSLLSEASVTRLGEILSGQGLAPVPPDRFRANIHIEGVEAHAEDLAVSIRVGEVVFGVAETQGRCVVTTVDQEAGRRVGPEPLRTLARYRRDGSGGAQFGVYAVALTPGRVRRGDPVALGVQPVPAR